MNVTFIGLGIMGRRMAANLLKNKVSLTVFNRSEAPALELKESGAKVAKSYADAVKDADVVFTMLSTPQVVSEIMFGTGCLSAMKKNALWVDSSTVNPSFSLESAKEAEAAGIRFVDAPVSGSKIPAENGSLIFLAGGSEADIRTIEPLLKFMGSQVIHAGGNGKGTSMKMLVNALLAESMVVFSETILLGEKLGLSKDFLLNTLPGMPVIAPYVKAKAALIGEKNYEPHFPLEWMYKDLTLVSKTADEVNQLLPVGNLTKELFGEATRNGMERLDLSAIYEYLNKRNNRK